MTVSIERLTAEHWPDVERIYAAGIATGHATFDAEPPTWEAFDAAKLSTQRLVAVSKEQVVGWVAASPTSARSEYAGVVEHSVYIDPPARGSGRRRNTAACAGGVDRGSRHLVHPVSGVP